MDNTRQREREAFRETLLAGARRAPLDRDFVRRFNKFVAERPHPLEWKDKDEYGRTILFPLHWYLRHAIKAKSRLATFQDLVIQTPQVLAGKDGCGYTLLHDVCRFNPTALDIVSFFVEQNPDTAKQLDKYQDTPLHCACQKRAPLAVIQVLVDANPRAVQICDKGGDAPLHDACYYGAPLDVIRFLSMQKPHVCLHQSKYLPLDRAKQRYPQDRNVIEFMTTATIAAARVLMKRFYFSGLPWEIFEQVVAYLHGRPVEVSMIKSLIKNLAKLSSVEMAVLFCRDDVRAEFQEQTGMHAS